MTFAGARVLMVLELLYQQIRGRKKNGTMWDKNGTIGGFNFTFKILTWYTFLRWNERKTTFFPWSFKRILLRVQRTFPLENIFKYVAYPTFALHESLNPMNSSNFVAFDYFSFYFRREIYSEPISISSYWPLNVRIKERYVYAVISEPSSQYISPRFRNQ